MVTGIYKDPASFANYKDMTGPLLNPALAFGQMVLSAEFSFIYIYMLMPFVGTVIALIFYEFVFVKTQDYLGNSEEDGDSEEGRNKGSKSFPNDSDDEVGEEPDIQGN
jgi:hypothetical protein